MVRTEYSVVVKRTTMEVFKFVAVDYFQNGPRWTPGLVELEKTSAGPMSLGTTGRVIGRDSEGRLIETAIVVTEYEPDRRFAVKASSVFAEVNPTGNLGAKEKSRSSHTERRHTFEPVGNETRITSVSKYEAGGIFSFILPIWGDYYRKNARQHLYNLAKAIGPQSDPRVRRKPPMRMWAAWAVFFVVFAALIWVHGARDQLHLASWVLQSVQTIIIVMVLILAVTISLFMWRKPA
jgi:polyketide cyclase/dehydrase/lipid transport protein